MFLLEKLKDVNNNFLNLIVQKVSHQTLAALRSLDISLLQEKLGSHLSSEEMDRILCRGDQVVNYFQSILKSGPALII